MIFTDDVDEIGDIGSVLLALESPLLYLGNPANMEFNHKGNLAPIWQFVVCFLIVPQVNITLHDDHGTLF